MMMKAHTRRYCARVAVVLAALALGSAAARGQESAQTESDSAARMQREIEELKDQLRALKEQVEALTRASAAQPAAPVAAAAAPEAAAPPPALQPTAAPQSANAGNAFNPAISAVFQGIGSSSINHNRDDDGFTLSEAEVGLQAVVDPYARVDMFLTFGADGSAEVEEGYMTFQTLPGGLQAKAGRFKSAFGKWNQLHDHAFFTVDRPDVLTSFFGEESLSSDGASLSWLVPGTGSAYVESITQVSSTPNDVTFNGRRRDPMFLQHLSSVFTLTSNATLELGASGATGKGGPSEQLLDAIDTAGLSGTLNPSNDLSSSIFGADLIWKWKPVQYNVYRSFLWQTEALQSVRRTQQLDPAGSLFETTVRSFGGYSYAEYQFAKRWRAGLRYDATEFPDDDTARQRGASVVLRVQPTEFQEFRFQFKHTGRNDAAAARFNDIGSDNEFFIEWIPVIGTHAAHKY